MNNIRKFASDSMAQSAVVAGVDERAAQAAHNVASAYLMHPKQWDELGESGKQLWRDVATAVKPILLARTTEGEDATAANAERELKDAIARCLSEDRGTGNQGCQCGSTAVHRPDADQLLRLLIDELETPALSEFSAHCGGVSQ